jgi:nicotinic acid phosphoribosyltransferase
VSYLATLPLCGQQLSSPFPFTLQPLGIRLDSGDLAYLSKEARAMFVAADRVFPFANLASNCRIVASNDINEAVLMSLNDQGHSIDTFGIGTNLVTCQAQPALGMVYKLVEINGKPRMKLSQEVTKVTCMPCCFPPDVPLTAPASGHVAEQETSVPNVRP